MSLHPTTRLMAWLVLLIAVQCLTGVALAAVFALLPFCGAAVLRRGWRLVWRARWLLLSLLVIFSWGVAGEPLWSGVTAPTREGLGEALTHFGRLLLVLVGVAAFLEAMPLPDLLSATHSLLKPLRYFGLNAERGVVRLMLVLRYVETLPRARDWRSLLKVPVSCNNERVEVDFLALRWVDYLACAGLVAVLAVCYFQ